jgi:hypothetical protein
MLQDALAASVPPLNEIVCGAVVDNVPPHCEEESVETVSPLGSVSVKLIPLRSTAVLGLVRVNVNMDAAPSATGLGENALLKLGEEGAPQPVKVTLSMLRSAPLLGVLAPVP